jgi:hypothetical protein
MRMVIDEFTLTYPGIRKEHEYFYAVHGAGDATRRGYLEKAYTLGHHSERNDVGVGSSVLGPRTIKLHPRNQN